MSSKVTSDTEHRNGLLEIVVMGVYQDRSLLELAGFVLAVFGYIGNVGG